MILIFLLEILNFLSVFFVCVIYCCGVVIIIFLKLLIKINFFNVWIKIGLLFKFKNCLGKGMLFIFEFIFLVRILVYFIKYFFYLIIFIFNYLNFVVFFN